MVCALFSSFLQCQKEMKEIGSEKVLHGACLTKGGGGSNAIESTHLKKGLFFESLLCKGVHVLYNIYI